MTISDWKEILAKYPDNMPVEIITFNGIEEDSTWVCPKILEIVKVSTSEHRSPDKKITYKVLNILVE